MRWAASISDQSKAIIAQAQEDGQAPALDIATQQLGYLKIIASNTGGTPLGKRLGPRL
jgi:hypothetical protein